MAYGYGLSATPLQIAQAYAALGNHGRLMLPWFDPEITPDVRAARVHRHGLDPADAAGNVRAVVEAQMMAMANHSSWMSTPVERIHATGGAAVNRDVLQVMADVFGVPVFPCSGGHGACLGSALRAWHGWLELRRLELGRDGPPPERQSEIALRIELAAVKERLKRLEAIANGVEL